MEITNKHRDVYKLIKNTKKTTELNLKSEDGQLAQELSVAGYLKAVPTSSGVVFTLTSQKLPRKTREVAYKKLYLVQDILKQFPIKRCERPKFGGRGRTWEKFEHIVATEKTNFHTDTSWGNYFYFAAPDDRWYKVELNGLNPENPFEFSDLIMESKKPVEFALKK
jgi:hypothetical protein